MEIVTIGSAKLIHGDCVEVMAGMEDGSVDHVIGDPPYSGRTHSKAKTNKKEAAAAGYRQGGASLVTFSAISDTQFSTLCRESLRLAKRWVVMTCDHRHAALTIEWEEHIRLGAWVKIGPMPQITGDRPGSGHEAVLCLHRAGRKVWNGGGKAGVWRHAPCKGGTEVPTEKPIALLLDLVADFTNPGETVLDPCMGSGTTGEACMNLGRKFVGIEMDRERFEIACRRLERAQSQQRLFA